LRRLSAEWIRTLRIGSQFGGIGELEDEDYYLLGTDVVLCRFSVANGEAAALFVDSRFRCAVRYTDESVSWSFFGTEKVDGLDCAVLGSFRDSCIMLCRLEFCNSDAR